MMYLMEIVARKCVRKTKLETNQMSIAKSGSYFKILKKYSNTKLGYRHRRPDIYQWRSGDYASE